MPKTSARPWAVREDAVLGAAVGVARAGTETVAHPCPVDEHVGFEMVSGRLATHCFASIDAGYVDWYWAVTVTRVPRRRVATVCEVGMAPREGALLAPAWVPWEGRPRPLDTSHDGVLPYNADDERLVQSFEGTSMDPDLPAVRGLGLGRVHVLSPGGHSQTAKRWYKSEHGPKSGRRPRNTYSTCDFLVKMSGDIHAIFGVCASKWATGDGAVISLDHTCGSHSETDMPKNGTVWPMRPSRMNEGALGAEPMLHASNEAKKSEVAAAEVTSAQAETPADEEPGG